ncbi:MAG TPA: hypothetical protein VFA49_01695 [Chloroflexota bacterium]|jgi:tellurite resistance protein|nr:hypothetical protein [Chloroflexota bacterium]
MPTDVVTLWWLTLAIGAVVILIVAVLLIAIVAAANRIDRHAADIWAAGKDIASNTIQIWQLQKTNATAEQILQTAQAIADGAGSIDARLAKLSESLAKRRP